MNEIKIFFSIESRCIASRLCKNTKCYSVSGKFFGVISSSQILCLTSHVCDYISLFLTAALSERLAIAPREEEDSASYPFLEALVPVTGAGRSALATPRAMFTQPGAIPLTTDATFPERDKMASDSPYSMAVIIIWAAASASCESKGE
jgi:hypothetical protein